MQINSLSRHLLSHAAEEGKRPWPLLHDIVRCRPNGTQDAMSTVSKQPNSPRAARADEVFQILHGLPIIKQSAITK